MKKTVSVILVLVMVLALGAVAFCRFRHYDHEDPHR